MTTATEQRTTTVGAHQAIEILADLISYRQLDYWLRQRMLQLEDPKEIFTGSGGRRVLTLTDVLRFRAVGRFTASVGQAYSLRDIAYAVNQLDYQQLTTELAVSSDWATITIDLTIDPAEEELVQWIATGTPPDKELKWSAGN